MLSTAVALLPVRVPSTAVALLRLPSTAVALLRLPSTAVALLRVLSTADTSSGPEEGDEETTPECWICREDGSQEPLIQPCACTGSMSGVHASCVEQWIRTVPTSGRRSSKEFSIRL